ncbi:MAG: hypothetical protein HFI93_01205 [Lachnospiraceae bacterium]|nr:hypothetical protein [Lachnospiraceae bacterium]
MCKFVKKIFSILLVLTALAGAAALIFYHFQRKDILSDDTMDELDHLNPSAEPEETRIQKLSRYSKDLLEKRSYVKIPFHE